MQSHAPLRPIPGAAQLRSVLVRAPAALRAAQPEGVEIEVDAQGLVLDERVVTRGRTLALRAMGLLLMASTVLLWQGLGLAPSPLTAFVTAALGAALLLAPDLPNGRIRVRTDGGLERLGRASWPRRYALAPEDVVAVRVRSVLPGLARLRVERSNGEELALSGVLPRGRAAALAQGVALVLEHARAEAPPPKVAPLAPPDADLERLLAQLPRPEGLTVASDAAGTTLRLDRTRALRTIGAPRLALRLGFAILTALGLSALPTWYPPLVDHLQAGLPPLPGAVAFSALWLAVLVALVSTLRTVGALTPGAQVRVATTGIETRPWGRALAARPPFPLEDCASVHAHRAVSGWSVNVHTHKRDLYTVVPAVLPRRHAEALATWIELAIERARAGRAVTRP